MKLKELFLNLQTKMQCEIGLGPYTEHPVEQGDLTEESWIRWLRDYLPGRYKVDKAKIVDCNEKMSEQIDIVIYDRHYSPMIFEVMGKKVVPAESVYCVFEVKPTLNKETINYASRKIKSVRVLERTSDKIKWANGLIDNPDDPFNILGGILTTDCGWSEKLESESFKSAINSLENNYVINIGCSLHGGAFWVNNSQIFISTLEEALLVFYLELLKKLRDLGTVPAIDYSRYSRVLETYKKSSLLQE